MHPDYFNELTTETKDTNKQIPSAGLFFYSGNRLFYGYILCVWKIHRQKSKSGDRDLFVVFGRGILFDAHCDYRSITDELVETCKKVHCYIYHELHSDCNRLCALDYFSEDDWPPAYVISY